MAINIVAMLLLWSISWCLMCILLHIGHIAAYFCL